jgi:hypothetical protein
VGTVEIGAEFMVRSFSRGNAMYIARALAEVSGIPLSEIW